MALTDKLTAIANGFRSSRGLSRQLSLDEMATLAAVPISGNSSDGTGTVNLQEKSVTPSASSQNVTPDSGFNGLSKVVVSAVPTETKNITTNGTHTASSGKWFKSVTVNVASSGEGSSSSSNVKTGTIAGSGNTLVVNTGLSSIDGFVVICNATSTPQNATYHWEKVGDLYKVIYRSGSNYYYTISVIGSSDYVTIDGGKITCTPYSGSSTTTTVYSTTYTWVAWSSP